jgi:hypothetical protein
VETKEHLEFSDFEGLLNDTFVLSIDGVEQTLEAELISAEKVKASGMEGAKREPFRIQFKLPPASNIGQCTMRVENPVFGAAEMFLVPVFEDDAGWYMDATFN